LRNYGSPQIVAALLAATLPYWLQKQLGPYWRQELLAAKNPTGNDAISENKQKTIQ